MRSILKSLHNFYLKNFTIKFVFISLLYFVLFTVGLFVFNFSFKILFSLFILIFVVFFLCSFSLNLRVFTESSELINNHFSRKKLLKFNLFSNLYIVFLNILFILLSGSYVLLAEKYGFFPELSKLPVFSSNSIFEGYLLFYSLYALTILSLYYSLILFAPYKVKSLKLSQGLNREIFSIENLLGTLGLIVFMFGILDFNTQNISILPPIIWLFVGLVSGFALSCCFIHKIFSIGNRKIILKRILLGSASISLVFLSVFYILNKSVHNPKTSFLNRIELIYALDGLGTQFSDKEKISLLQETQRPFDYYSLMEYFYCDCRLEDIGKTITNPKKYYSLVKFLHSKSITEKHMKELLLLLSSKKILFSNTYEYLKATYLLFENNRYSQSFIEKLVLSDVLLYQYAGLRMAQVKMNAKKYDEFKLSHQARLNTELFLSGVVKRVPSSITN